ncbi:hypothetical protein ABPG75_009807 [Micractinium tetrahymenae]
MAAAPRSAGRSRVAAGTLVVAGSLALLVGCLFYAQLAQPTACVQPVLSSGMVSSQNASLAPAGGHADAPKKQADLGETRCRGQCCWRVDELPWAYGGEKGRYPGVDDRISPADSKMLADVVVHNQLPWPPWQPALPVLTSELVPCLQPGTVIFVEGDALELFFTQFFPNIEVPHVIVSGDSDNSTPAEWRRFLNNTKIIAWYAYNCDVPNAHTVEKFFCWPLGLSQWVDMREHMQRAFDTGLAPLHWQHIPDPAAEAAEIDRIFLVNYAERTNSGARQEASKHFCETLQQYSTCNRTSGNSHMPFEYYQRVRRHMFNVSPAGAGIDSFRIWETLYLGRYPVMLSSTIDESLSGLPVWVLDRWEDATAGAARLVFEVFTRKQHQWEKLYKGFWQRRLAEHRAAPYARRNVKITYTPNPPP